MSSYALDNAWHRARERLTALEANQDPGTIRHLTALGVGSGYRCLEVGAGGGSIAAWLAKRVGPTGSVLATDIDTRFLDVLAEPNLEVREHDLAAEDLPVGEFDLVHARLVLVHLPDPQRALQRLVAALRPGGWLLVEEPDFVSRVPDPTTIDAELMGKAERAAAMNSQRVGMNRTYGRRLYSDVVAAGLIDVEAEGRVALIRGGTVDAEIQRLTWVQLREGLVDTGLITGTELDALVHAMETETPVWMGPITMAVWGRKPD
jgi:SAM-dependent methyltransferase